MEKALTERILKIQETTMNDADYCLLMDEHTVRNAQFLAVMESMTQDQQNVIYDYLGVVIEMHSKMLEIVLSSGAG